MYSILINTTDSYEACWKPFFQLFDTYWANEGSIYLNTEFKDFSYKNLNIIPMKNGIKNNKNNWGSCLRKALDYIPTDIILYLQEDYFLNDFVNTQAIDYYVNLMKKYDLTYIGLTPFATKNPSDVNETADLWYLDEGMKYRLSLQASIWNKNKMQKYIKEDETPWKFEIEGSKRVGLDKEFYCVNRNLYNKDNQIVPYHPSGVLKGKWNKKVVEDLFKKHNIKVK